MDTCSINEEFFRLRGKHNGANIGDGEIILLVHIICVQNNNRIKDKKDYCSESDADLADYLCLPQTDSGIKKVQRMLLALDRAGFIIRKGRAPRRILAQYNIIDTTIEKEYNKQNGKFNKYGE